MQNTRGKASSFPFLVMLCVIVAHLLLDAFGIAGTLRVASLHNDYDPSRFHVLLSMTLGRDIGFLVISAAFSLAGTQWVLERRRVAGLPGYAAVCIGVLNVVIATAWGFLSAFLAGAVFRKMTTEASMHLALTVSTLSGYVLYPLWLLFSIWLVFRLFRTREQPAAGIAELRGRALLVFGLFAWSWVMLVLSLAVPMGAGYLLYMNGNANPMTLYLGPYIGSVVLAMPAFLGAVLGLPARMPAVQPLRVWLAATLSMLLSAVVMLGLAFLAAKELDVVGDDGMPNMGVAALVALLWFVVSTLLCWLLVRWLTRKPMPPESYRHADSRLPDRAP